MTRQQAVMTLGLNISAREDEIRKAWRTKARFYHPDSPYGNMGAFLKCKQAYETLIPPAPQSIRIPARSRAL